MRTHPFGHWIVVAAAALTGAGCASQPKSDRTAGTPVSHILVRVVAVPDATSARGGQHKVEMQFLSGVGAVFADGAGVRAEVGEEGAQSAVVAERFRFGSEYKIEAAPEATATDGNASQMIGLRSRARPAGRGSDSILSVGEFGDLHGRFTVTPAGDGAVDLILSFAKEEMSPGALAGGPPDAEHHQVSIHLNEGQSVLLSTGFLGEVCLR